jgi:phage terminase small subunit
VKGKLPPRQQRFVEEYLVDLNATQASIRAGYSKRTADVQGPRLLGNVRIAAEIQRLKEARAEKMGITAARVLEEVRRLALSDIRCVFDENGKLRAVADLSEEQAAAISSVEVVTSSIPIGHGEVEIESTHKLKAWDKLRALELLAKHLGLLRDRVELTGADGVALTGLWINVVAARE